MKSGAGGRNSCQACQLLLLGTHLVASFVCLQIKKGLEQEGLCLSLGLGSQERTFLLFLIPEQWGPQPAGARGGLEPCGQMGGFGKSDLSFGVLLIEGVSDFDMKREHCGLFVKGPRGWRRIWK